MSDEYSIKYFPFSPGIPWVVKKRIIVPEVPHSILYDTLSGRKVTVIAYGGLLESFFSFSILEQLNHFIPSAQLFWEGNDKFTPLVKMNGLAAITKDPVGQETLRSYPVPLFFDRDGNAYFNCLNNYIKKRACDLSYIANDYKAVAEQVVRNGLFKWSTAFIPDLRFMDYEKLDNYLKSIGLSVDSAIVTIFPDDTTDLSIHDTDCLGWNAAQVRAFAAILKQKFITPIIITNSPQKYSYSQAHVLHGLDLSLIIYLLQSSCAILSKNPDFLIVGNAVSNAKLVSAWNKKHQEFKINKNNKVLGNRCDIYMKKAIDVVDVARYIIDE
jgi:hypothetical protein